MKTPIIKRILTWLSAALVAASAHGAPITWGPAQQITNSPTDVSTVGTLVSAVGGVGVGASRVVNGVTFANSRILGDNTGNLAASEVRDDYISSRIPASLEDNYEVLLQYYTRYRIQAGPAVVPLSGLTPGNKYAVQAWVSDNANTPRNNAMILDAGTPGARALLMETTDGGTGQYVIGTFTADAATQTFSVQSYTNMLTTPASAINNSFLNALQVRDITGVVIAVNPDASTVSASPAAVPADGTTASTITVTLIDTLGLPVPDKDVTLAGSPGGAVISPATAVTTNSSGQAAFNVKSTSAGTVVFTATNTTDSQTITQTASVIFASSADAGVSTVAAAPSSVIADGITTSTITVSLKAAGKMPVPGKSVTLAQTLGTGATITPATAQTTDVNGQVVFTVKSATPGAAEFTATDVSDSLVITQKASVNFVDPSVPHAFHVSFVQFTPVLGNFEDPATLSGPAGGSGETWNQFRAVSGSNLLAADGTATSVAVTTTFTESRSRSTGSLVLLKHGLTDFDKGLSRTVTISGLPPGSLYSVWLASTASMGAASENANGTFSTTNATSTVGGQLIDQSVTANTNTWQQGNNYVQFENVVVNGSGQIVVTAASTPGYRLPLNGLQLVPAGKARITSFTAAGNPGVIDQNAFTIGVSVPFATNLATLAPTFTLNSGICNQISGSPPSPTFASANPVTYTVTDGGTVNNYAVTVTVAPASSACAMLTCDFGALGQAVIDEVTGKVLLTVPPNQPVTSLAPTFTLSAGASISPASGSTQNFTNPVVYRVTAENGSTHKDYTVSVQSYATWAHSGSMFIDTTTTGADVTGSVSNFPLLVRFNSANFNFAQAQSDGRDIRFTTASGTPLSYQIEHWDAAVGSAAVWVKIPTITGNALQEIIMYWGKSGVSSLSSGTSVFSSSNGYASVIHLGDTLTDETGTTSPSNLNSTAINGLIGRARTFAAGQGVLCGSNITGLPTGNGPFSTGVWIRTAKSPGVILGWGTHESAQKKVIMSVASPPSIKVECWFGGADIAGTASVPKSEWTYVVHTFQTSGTRLYVNGALDASNNGGTMQLKTTGRLDIGGWQPDGGFNYVGDIDEVRISNMVRSADWVKLEYENQKPTQTLVGGIVPSGSDFSVSPSSLTMNEGTNTTLTAQAGGARKIYWIYKKGAQKTVLATDQLTYTHNAGRVSADDSAVIQFKAVFAGGTQTIDVPLTVFNTVPDPAFTLTPSTTSWDGRQTMTVTANISNLAAMQAAGFGTVDYQWSVSGVAVIKQANQGTLTLTRSQGSGPMTVTLTAHNGGTPVSNSIVINVQEPASDPWVERTPGANEKAVNGQFIARNPFTNLGTVFYNGTQGGSPNSVYLKVYKTPAGGSETLDATYRQSLVGDAYAFSAPIAAGLITYRVVYGTTTNGTDTDVATVSDVVCGDAYLIEGQSNAVANQTTDLTTDPFVRSYGTNNQWGRAVRSGNEYRIGSWGMPLALHLKSTYNMPICIINAAVGGTRIDQHMPNPVNRALPLAPGFGGSIYADLYNRVNGAKLSHGIRGVFWHQGESNSGADSPTGDWDYKSYQQYFIDLSAEWKQDFPNIQRYIIFQVQPKPCAMGPKGDQLREVQRTLPRLFSNMSILSTIGVDTSLGYDGCHYSTAGYQFISDMLVQPLARRDFYNELLPYAVTAPNLVRAYYTNSTRNRIALEFDQPTQWNPTSPQHFYLDDVAANISSGSHSGNVVTLQLASASNSLTIDYVQDQKPSWDGNAAKLITGANTIAALTFADVAIGPAPPAGLSAVGGSGQVALTWTATTGATGYKVKRSTTSGGPYTTIATTAVPSYTDLSVTSGTPYFYVVSAVSTVGTSSSEGLDSAQATATPLGGYAAWAANPAQGLTAGVNDGPLMDPDFDGIPNLLEFVLGGAPMTSSRAVMPAFDQVGGQWLFAYDRNRESLPPATTQIVQYSIDMLTWHDIIVPATSSGAVTVTPGSTFDRVVVTIPVLGPQTFARLKASQ